MFLCPSEQSHSPAVSYCEFRFLAILVWFTCAIVVTVYKLYYIEVALSISICHISLHIAGRQKITSLYLKKNLFMFITLRWEVHLLTFIVGDAV